MRTLLLIAVILITSISIQAQTQYTGLFYSPSNEGVHTDSYFNLIPNSGSTALNFWNIYHKEGNPIFSVWFGSAQPYVHIGAGRRTNLIVNGSITALDPTFDIINLKIDASSIPGLKFTRWTGSGSTQHNAFVGQFYNQTAGEYSLGIGTGVSSSGDQTVNTNALIVRLNGNVGIGTENPDQKLTINGKIKCEEVTVVVDVADYVFEENYSLKSLNEVEQYVKENKHLPGVPGKKEVDANGYEVGQMTNKLLEKIEELTLYLIEQNKEIKSLQEENKKMMAEIANLNPKK